jgi:hypothetical protein
MGRDMTRRIARLVDRNCRSGMRALHGRFGPACDPVQAGSGRNGRPTTERLRQWLRAVPWRHVWILGLLALLLVLALFGFFPEHRASGHALRAGFGSISEGAGAARARKERA